jgi:hypothetical protein
MAKARSNDFKTPPCRLAFSQSLFKPRAVTEGGPKRYGCTLIFESKYRPQLEKPIAEVIVSEWGEKGLLRAKAGGIRSPILAGDGKEARSKQNGELHPGFGPGLIFIRCQANEDRPPRVHYRSPDIAATSEEVYSGCYGFAVINCFAWHHPQNGDGVSFGIRYFQKTRDGESIGGVKPIDVHEYFEQVDDDSDLVTEKTTGAAGAGGLFG